MCRISCLLLFVIVISIKFAQAQRAFLSRVNGVTRSYELYYPDQRENQPNLPLILFLGTDQTGDRSKAKSDSVLTNLNLAAILAFPGSTLDQWPCTGDTVFASDLAFIKTIIGETFENFRINRNKVFIVSRGKSECLAIAYISAFPGTIAGTRHFSDPDEGLKNQLAAVNGFLTNHSSSPQRYQLWQNPLYNEEERKKEMEDSIKRVRWEKRVSVEFRAGMFLMHPSVKTVKDQTYMNISDARQLLDLNITSWMNDSMAWFVDIGWLKLPQKQEVDGVRIEAGGGMIVPITVGLRYTLYRKKARPYFLLGTGPMQVIVFGGRFRMDSDPSQIKNKINAEARFALHTAIGTGMDYRMGKRIVVGAHARYIHSSKFESTGSVNAVRGFNLSISGGYIIGANRLGMKKKTNK